MAVGATGFVIRERDDWLMESRGIKGDDHPPFLRVQLHEAVDRVDADEFDEQGDEVQIETAKFSSLE